MKKQAYTLIATIVLISSVAVAAKAQNNGRPTLTANIPFQFNVGNKIMPAGEYLVRSVNDDSANVVLNIQRRDGKASAMLMTRTVEGKAKESGTLIFNRYGNQYFFAEAWVDGNSAGLRVPKSRAERAIQLELAGVKPTAETIALKRR